MFNLVLTIAAWSLHLPNVDTFEAYNWQPVFTKSTDLQLTQPTVAFVTHATRHFDPLCLTQPGVNRVVETMKKHQLSILYLHDEHNQNNPGWMYLYRDLKPTAFISSDVGKFDVNLATVRHAISLGGYFGQCQRSTVQDIIRCWRRDAKTENLRLTQVLDGIFCVGEYVRWEDPFRPDFRSMLYDDLRKRHPNSAICLADSLSLIRDQDLAIDFLCRQIPAIPADVNVQIDFFGSTETVLYLGDDFPTLTLAYRYSSRFLPYSERAPQAKNVMQRNLRRGFTSRVIRLLP